MSHPEADYERTIAIGEKAFAHVRSHRTAAYPRAYELWYTYVAGHHPALMRAVNDLLRRFGRVTQTELDEIYDRFINSNRFTAEAERATVRLLGQMDGLGTALTTHREGLDDYRGALARSADDLEADASPEALRGTIAELMRSTREAGRLNGALADQLAEARAEVGELRDSLESIRTESQVDTATTLTNRRAFDAALRDAVGSAARSGEALALLMIDIDHFRAFNDSYGHPTGDQVLRLVAMTVKQNVKGLDTAARYGGEEVAVMLPGSDMRGATAVADQLRRSVMARELVKRSTGENLGRVTVSVGVAVLRQGDDEGALVARAETCLLAAKRAGRNRVVCEADLEAEVAVARVA